jgi:hypothetical protein
LHELQIQKTQQAGLHLGSAVVMREVKRINRMFGLESGEPKAPLDGMAIA